MDKSPDKVDVYDASNQKSADVCRVYGKLEFDKDQKDQKVYAKACKDDGGIAN